MEQFVTLVSVLDGIFVRRYNGGAVFGSEQLLFEDVPMADRGYVGTSNGLVFRSMSNQQFCGWRKLVHEYLQKTGLRS